MGRLRFVFCCAQHADLICGAIRSALTGHCSCCCTVCPADDIISNVHVHSSGVLQCRPQSVVRTGSDQTIMLTWEDDPSCPAVDDDLIYELAVLIANKQVHYVRHDFYYIVTQ